MTSPPALRPAVDQLVSPAAAGCLAAAIGRFAVNLAPEAERA